MSINPDPKPYRAVLPEIVSRVTGPEQRRAPSPHRSVLATTRTPSGQTLDWIAPDSQPGGGAAPPPSTPRRLDPAQRRVTFELHDDSVARGPAGTVPILRRYLPDGADDASHHVLKRKVDLRRLATDTQPADPDPSPFFHATSSQGTLNFGCETVLNVWQPYCQMSWDHSISQFGIQNYDLPKLQSIEAGWSVCQQLNGDYLTHLFTYYTTNGYGGDGDNQGGYNQHFDGWVQHDGSVYPGALLQPVSAYGGGQTTVSLKCQLWNGNWWLEVQGIWLGYYPANLFMPGQSTFSTLGDHGSFIGFWGEVASTIADPTQTTTDMGSGYFPDAGWSWAAYQSNTKVQTDRGGTMADSDGTRSVDNSALYDIRLNMLSGTSWGSYFWFGGPGAG